MPTVGENEAMWGRTYDWTNAERDWSSGWGGADGEWYAVLWPRLRHLLPTGTVVEVACGHGRWTEFLRARCEHLVAIDLAQSCVDACAARFAEDPRVSVRRTDGRTLPGVDDGSVDLVFSFDSLVHADAGVLDAYLGEAARVLTPDGAAFLHHSNLAGCRLRPGLRRLPVLPDVLDRLGVMDRDLHWRDPTVGAEVVSAAAEGHGLRCVTQELIPWGTGRMLIDCISTVVRAGSPADRGRHVIENPAFGADAPALAALARARSAREGGAHADG